MDEDALDAFNLFKTDLIEIFTTDMVHLTLNQLTDELWFCGWDKEVVINNVDLLVKQGWLIKTGVSNTYHLAYFPYQELR
jgi:hypothetical protein